MERKRKSMLFEGMPHYKDIHKSNDDLSILIGGMILYCVVFFGTTYLVSENVSYDAQG
jgi:hypothetical protein